MGLRTCGQEQVKFSGIALRSDSRLTTVRWMFLRSALRHRTLASCRQSPDAHRCNVNGLCRDSDLLSLTFARFENVGRRFEGRRTKPLSK